MAPGLRSHRSKSTSDILDDIASDEEKVQGDLSVENRYRTYTLEDFKEKKSYFAKGRGRQRESSSEKSQSFVKKLIASLERKNEICKADDEFFTEYYNKNDCYDPNSDINKKRDSFRVNSDRNISQNFKCKPVFKNKVGEFANSKINEQFRVENLEKSSNAKESALGHLREEEETFGAGDQRRNGHPKSLPSSEISQEACSGREFNVNENKQKKKLRGSSSFDPNTSRVELRNHVDSPCSYFLRKNNDDRKRNTLERIFTNSKKEEDVTLGTSARKKLDRSRSFKEFLGSMIRRKKSKYKEKPRRFMSYDHLAEETETFDSKNAKKLSRTSSLNAVVFQDRDEENSTRSGERRATIRPVYGGRRNEQVLEVLTKRKEFRKFSATDESVEDLVKPSAIRDIARHLSRFPAKSEVNEKLDGRGRRIPR